MPFTIIFAASSQRRYQPLDETRRAEHASIQPDEIGLELERQEVRRLLNQLKEDQRSVLILRFLVGLSSAETAAAMGKSDGAVRVLQHRALKALRERLAASQED